MERSRRTALYLDFGLYGLSAAFAGYTAVWSTLPAHRFWGSVAVGGYLPAAIVTVMLLSRYAAPVLARVWVAVGTTAAVTVMPLLAEVVQRAGGNPDRAQEEVLVVEESGSRLLDTGSPYLSADTIAALPPDQQLLSYDPYQPGMAVFGLPRAVFGAGWATDARVWFAVVTIAAIAAALWILNRDGMPRGAWVRAVQAVGVLPICALTLATGGDDLPVLALCLLALAALSTRRHVLAGVAIGLAAALKLFAWPVLIVLLVLVIRRGGWRGFVPAAVALPAISLLPSLVWHHKAFIDNVVSFPFGAGVVTSPAASPLPGYLIANHLPAGRPIALSLLCAAAVAIGVALLRRPPGTAHSAAAICAFGLLAAIALMPASRFGYLLYPAALGIWWWCLKTTKSPTPNWGTRLTAPAVAGNA